ncbi:MAG: hypothetical protein HY390_06495 [Deltaproteobacteria bacterium]|nr:hypothetical protein [Deltaproteobacteria bacterium]
MQNRVVVAIVKACFVIAFSLTVTLAFSYPLIPDPEITQGDLCTEDNPDFAKYRYQENIPYCQRNVSKARREKIYEKYNIPSHCRYLYTIDHFIPLSIGGSNADQNLWPEHVLVKATRPKLEEEIYLALAQGELNQQEAIDIIIKEKTTEQQSPPDNNSKGECN